MPSEFMRPVNVLGPEHNYAMVTFTTAGTGTVTTVDAWGCTVARTGVGVFVITLATVGKHFNVTLGTEFTTAAQTTIVTAKSLTNRTVTITVVGAGGSTATDTTGMTINAQIAIRWSN
jgi:hypothetical protein